MIIGKTVMILMEWGYKISIIIYLLDSICQKTEQVSFKYFDELYKIIESEWPSIFFLDVLCIVY